MNKEMTASWEEKISPLVIALFLKHANGTFVQQYFGGWLFKFRLAWPGPH